MHIKSVKLKKNGQSRHHHRMALLPLTSADGGDNDDQVEVQCHHQLVWPPLFTFAKCNQLFHHRRRTRRRCMQSMSSRSRRRHFGTACCAAPSVIECDGSSSFSLSARKCNYVDNNESDCDCCCCSGGRNGKISPIDSSKSNSNNGNMLPLAKGQQHCSSSASGWSSSFSSSWWASSFCSRLPFHHLHLFAFLLCLTIGLHCVSEIIHFTAH